jgi:hypothetical protein
MQQWKLGLVLGAFAIGGAVGCHSDGDDSADPDARIVRMPDAAPMPDAPPGTPDAGPMNINVSADITTSTTWTYPNTYFLKKHVYVKNGATLTIEPGVIVRGEAMTSLVITREGKIDAVGTAARPIVFTSFKDPPQAAPSDWGGVVLLGKAKINDTAGELGIEGFPAGTAEVLYGGADDTHDCGKLKYVRVEFAGYVLEANKELNGISVGACGSKTELDFIQIHKSSDDGIEFFGGTANLKHFIADQGADDGLDWDFGWTGKAQFVVVQLGQGDGENGFESDNHPANFDLTPRAAPTIFNVTIVGPDAPTGKKKTGMLLRRGTAAKLANVILFNLNGLPIDVRDTATVSQTPASLYVKNSIFFQNPLQAAWNDTTDNDGNFDEGAYFLGASMNNSTADPALAAPTNLTAPSFKPATGSPALVPSNAATPPNDGFFDTTATFIGAVGATDWTLGWTAYP